MNFWRAFAVACLIVAITCALLVALMLRAEPQPISCMPDDDMREKVKQVMLEALDEGLKNRIGKVFEVWMVDDSDQPRRATVGARNAIRGYVGARTFVLKWNPPKC